MTWYYAQGQQRYGPVDDDAFRQLVAQGVVTAATLVWHEGMPTWIPYRDYVTAQTVSAGVAGTGPGQVVGGESAGPAGQPATGFCSQCGRQLATEDMLDYQGAWVCAACKDGFFQCRREGVAAVPSPLSVAMGYGQALPTSGYATAALVLGICSIPTCACYGIVSLICGILAVIFSGKAKRAVAEGRAASGSMSTAKAGKICGIIGIVLGIAYLVCVVVVIFLKFDRAGASPGF